MRSVILGLALGAIIPLSALAVTVDVDAAGNSVNNDSGPVNGASTGVILNVGDSFSVLASITDDWQLCFGHPTDPDGCAVNADGKRTLDNTTFFTYTLGDLSAVVGTLVGSIGAGPYFAIGTSFSGVADVSGELKLFAWDTDSNNNNGTIAATVTKVAAIPLPTSGALLVFAALGGLAALRRSR